VNTGLQGMHSVMWKLAWFVRGRAGWPLVATYETERRGVAQGDHQPVAAELDQRAAHQCRSRFGAQGALTAEQVVTASRRYGNHLGVEFGSVYQSSAVIADGTQPPQVADSYSDYVPSATPGARAPHVWLGQARLGCRRSTCLAARSPCSPHHAGGAWCSMAAEIEHELSVPIHRCRVGEPGLRDLGGFTDAYGLGVDGAVLVRPDGHVAWRSATGAAIGTTLRDAVERLLARSQTARP
jgi:hypothetical protein